MKSLIKTCRVWAQNSLSRWTNVRFKFKKKYETEKKNENDKILDKTILHMSFNYSSRMLNPQRDRTSLFFQSLRTRSTFLFSPANRCDVTTCKPHCIAHACYFRTYTCPLLFGRCRAAAPTGHRNAHRGVFLLRTEYTAICL